MDVAIRVANSLLMMAMPLGLGIALARRLKVGWHLFGAGALTFVVSQILHLPFNRWVLGPLFEWLNLEPAEGGLSGIWIAICLGLSAGVFEEGARYLTYRRFLKQARTWGQALMFGAGHGGIEAVLLGMLALYTLFQATALRDADLASVLPAEQVELARAQLAAYWAVPWYGALLGSLERLLALAIHLSLSVLVLQAVTRRRWVWLALAIGWHALIDAAAVYALMEWGAYAVEGIAAVLAALSLGVVFVLRREPATAEHAPQAAIPESTTQAAGERDLPPDRLDESRYVD